MYIHLASTAQSRPPPRRNCAAISITFMAFTWLVTLLCTAVTEGLLETASLKDCPMKFAGTLLPRLFTDTCGPVAPALACAAATGSVMP